MGYVISDEKTNMNKAMPILIISFFIMVITLLGAKFFPDIFGTKSRMLMVGSVAISCCTILIAGIMDAFKGKL